jgi:hypothetical protein
VRYFVFAPARRVFVMRAVAAVVLVLGYVDLVRGGISAAPVLLVIGYVLLVPAVILSWR